MGEDASPPWVVDSVQTMDLPYAQAAAEQGEGTTAEPLGEGSLDDQTQAFIDRPPRKLARHTVECVLSSQVNWPYVVNNIRALCGAMLAA